MHPQGPSVGEDEGTVEGREEKVSAGVGPGLGLLDGGNDAVGALLLEGTGLGALLGLCHVEPGQVSGLQGSQPLYLSATRKQPCCSVILTSVLALKNPPIIVSTKASRQVRGDSAGSIGFHWY